MNNPWYTEGKHRGPLLVNEGEGAPPATRKHARCACVRKAECTMHEYW